MSNTGTITDLYINSTRQLLLCGSSLGFFIYDIRKNKHTLFRNFSDDGGVKIIRLLGTSNVSGFTTNNNPKVVVIWDDFQNKCVCKIECDSEVKNLIITREFIIVVEISKICIYSFIEKKLIKLLQTGNNTHGHCLLSQSNYLLFPSDIVGNVSVYNITNDELLPDMNVHNNEIECMALSADETIIFTASSQGTIIRGYDIAAQENKYEFRRGLGNAKIFSIATDINNKLMAVSGNTGTIHIYSLDPSIAKNKESSLGYFKGILPQYFSSQWSNSSITVKNTQPSVITFRENDATDQVEYLVVAFLDGSYHKYKIDLESTTVTQVKQISLLRAV